MTHEEHIARGFNAGYQLQQANPELATHLQKAFADKDHPYAKGFAAGMQEYSKEKELSKDKSSYLSKLQDRIKQEIKSKSPETSKDKDHGIEP